MRSMWRYIYWITLWILFFGLTVKHSIFTVMWPQCQLQHTQVITFMAGSSSIPCHGTFMTARVAHTFVRIHMDKKISITIIPLLVKPVMFIYPRGGIQ